jgi:hypothetical protein
MAQSSWPFENVDTSETQFSQWARNIGEGVKQGSGDELEAYGDSSGMNVKVGTGQALVRGHYYSNTAEVTLVVTTADATNPRIDNVVLELDPSANSIVLKVVAGTPGATPSAPAVTQTDGGIYQIKLAEIAVAAGATTISAGNVTDTRPMLTSAADLAGSITALEATKAPLTPAVNAKTGAYTLVAGDRGEFITCSGTFTITIPSGVFSAGDRVDFVNIGTGVITFAGSGVTVNSVDGAVTIDTQWAGATFFFTSSSAGVLIGKLA